MYVCTCTCVWHTVASPTGTIELGLSIRTPAAHSYLCVCECECMFKCACHCVYVFVCVEFVLPCMFLRYGADSLAVQAALSFKHNRGRCELLRLFLVDQLAGLLCVTPWTHLSITSN